MKQLGGGGKGEGERRGGVCLFFCYRVVGNPTRVVLELVLLAGGFGRVAEHR